MSSNCNQLCSLRPEHPGQHKCNSPQHMCKTTCSLPSCNNPCVLSVESKREKHQCHERYCHSKCTISGCCRTCGEKDHFHALDPYAAHFCGNEHACPENCEMPGICEISTKLVRQTCHYMGQRGSCPYEQVSEQKGLRKDCCILIPPFERSHKGLHVHNRDAESVHYCDTKCQGCGYFCQLPINHHGLHDTVHGNMKNVRFSSENENIEIQDRKYKWGETGDAEMCDVYCRKQGRGHIHLILCPEYKPEANMGLNPQQGMCTSNFHDGSRHQTVKYGPDIDDPKDEMTHETYWRYIGFVDPDTQDEQQEFGGCNQYCIFAKHMVGLDEEEVAETKTEFSGDRSYKSYCTKKMWHSAVLRTEENANSAGYVSTDGHHFSCRHSMNVPHHVIFVIDKSTSMAYKDITPTMPQFSETNNCRLGCVYEGILKFIQTRRRTFSGNSVSMVLFHKSAEMAVEMQDMKESVVDTLLHFHAANFFDWRAALDRFKKVARGGIGDFLSGDSPFGTGTVYTSGLNAAEEILLKATRDCRVDMKIPVVIFISDGKNHGSDPLPCLERMKRIDPRMVLHTIMYSKHPPTSTLQEMAEKGGGSCHVDVDEVQLSRAFEFFSRRTIVASYIYDN
ncbi:hypothetical protein SUGI_0672620 [Cryptomeria japonica]|nr:hypothetical protein SUGI_0672620 [Cryptomeria japonica]